MNYSLMQKENDSSLYLVAADLVDSVMKNLNISLRIVDNISGIMPC